MGRPLAEQPPLPSYERLHEMLEYDLDSGTLKWKEKSYFAGKLAGGINVTGYHKLMLDRKSHFSHRVIWKMMTGEDPIEIDHIDGNRANNRLSNLRNVSRAVNQRNKALYKNNKSGVPGVEYHSRDQVWQVKVGVGAGKQLALGSFKTKDEAIAGRICANVLLDYHDNHGRTQTGDV